MGALVVMSLTWSLAVQAAPQVEETEEGGVLIRPGGQVVSAAELAAPRPLVSDAAPISLDLQEADIHSVLRLISTTAGVNIVASDAVGGKVTVRLEDVPWDLALAATWYGDNILLVEPIQATGRR